MILKFEIVTNLESKKRKRSFYGSCGGSAVSAQNAEMVKESPASTGATLHLVGWVASASAVSLACEAPASRPTYPPPNIVSPALHSIDEDPVVDDEAGFARQDAFQLVGASEARQAIDQKGSESRQHRDDVE